MIAQLLSRTLRAGFAKEVAKASTGSVGSMSYYKDGQLVSRNALVLKKTEDVEKYVIKIVQEYYRSTFKNGITPQSKLAEHGMDSLDAIQIAMRIEDDLGYVISAETLPAFTEVKHYIAYIEQVEAFKREHNKNPLP